MKVGLTRTNSAMLTVCIPLCTVLLIALALTSCSVLDNSGRHKPIYLREDLPIEIRRQYLQMDMNSDPAPWPLCRNADKWRGYSGQQIDEPEAVELLEGRKK
jgi:hypothetical protein